MRACLEILQVLGPAWVQDLGRPGHMSEGMPWGGAMVPELLLGGNLLLGNPGWAAGIEFFGQLRIRLPSGLRAACNGRLLPLQAEHELAPAAGQRLGVLALSGGVDVPLCMQGRGTLPTVGIGGFQGRPLQAGDALPLGQAAALPKTQGRLSAPDLQQPLPVYPGPDLQGFASAAWDLLLQQEWTLSAPSDRTGTRLKGPRLIWEGAQERPSMPMVAGAIQVPPSGQPLVLGPDHPVTGGYPLIGVLPRSALGSLHLRPLGGRVCFQAAELSL